MRIILANYRYFVSGGPERYLFSVTDALTERGHEVIPFSIHYNRNEFSPYGKYFVPPLGNKNEVTFREHRPSVKTLYRTFSRLFYARDVERAVLKAANDTKPQVAYVLHYLRKLSPSLLVGLKKAGIPIVVRLSDYAMLCPQAHFLRNGKVCELCASGNLLPSVTNRCVQGALAPSLLNFLATRYHTYRDFFGLVDMFVTTNELMYQKMLAANYPRSRLRCIPTFVDTRTFHPDPGFVKGDYFIFFGGLERIKGVHILLDALELLRNKRPDLKLRVKLAGAGDPSYVATLKQKIERAGLGNIMEFLGFLSATEISRQVRGALFSIVPSICYENLPNAILESYACGTPVLASNLGSLSLCVEDEKTGYLFQPGNASELAEKIALCLDNPEHTPALSKAARQTAQNCYAVKTHLMQLEEMFTELVANTKKQ